MQLSLSGLAREVKKSLIQSEGRITKSEIYLSNLTTGEEIQFALTPDKVKIKTAANFRSYNIVELGEIKIPKGEQLMRISWQGILPGANMLLNPVVNADAYDNPQEVAKDLERWKSDGDKLRLLVTQTPLNLEVYIKDFDCTFEGGQGNITYDIDFLAAVDLEILTVAEADARRNEQSQLKSRPRQKSKLGQQIKTVDDIYSAIKILTGQGTLADVEKIFGKNDLTLDDENFPTVIWG